MLDFIGFRMDYSQKFVNLEFRLILANLYPQTTGRASDRARRGFQWQLDSPHP